MFRIFLLVFLTLTVISESHAQQNQSQITDGGTAARILELNWLNRQFLDKQRKRVNELTRQHFGQHLKTSESDLALIQRIIDSELIPTDETLELQALGVVLGDVFVDQHRDLMWQVYEDELGKSHAVCVRDTQHCLFPVTMLSRRIEVGARPVVNDVYKKGIDAITTYLPKLPFSN